MWAGTLERAVVAFPTAAYAELDQGQHSKQCQALVCISLLKLRQRLP